jgi:hypothetical protein
MANSGGSQLGGPIPGLGWTDSDSSRTIWGLSHTHLANAIDQFSKSAAGARCETAIAEAVAARTGFDRLASSGARPELTKPLAAACEDLARGLADGDEDRTLRGYSTAETVVHRIRAQFGFDVGRSWNLQEIDREFDQLVEASALLVERLGHKHLTETDNKNTYELAVKISHGWTRLVNGSYFLAHSVPRAEAAENIVSGMGDPDPQRLQTGVDQMTELAARLANGLSTVVTGAQPHKGDPVTLPAGVPGGRYIAAADGRPLEGLPGRWSVDVVLSNPRRR